MSMIGRFLFFLGVAVMVVELIANVVSIARFSAAHAVGMNWGSEIDVLLGSFFEGGMLIGLGKIIELLERKR
ncbi:hypothetical protein [Alicyclobacillus sp. ALC3]|uniref:hypothetical protein n=1 Tax=Alicyclobacillus sp. ALC3 TaxID=2796143 RepID=UPI0023785558|nr:hypothetical protein [Alicyclobacillus sp. ALC3]WDL98465.1 hypothetical protein JC200_07220 [Alicyclobacillus sp. ALC3]